MKVIRIKRLHLIFSIITMACLLLYVGIQTSETKSSPIYANVWKQVKEKKFMEVDLLKVCEATPPFGFKAWNRGVVTTLEPQVKRNCSKVYEGDPHETERIRTQKANWENAETDHTLLQNSANCSWVVEYFRGNMYTTKQERSFPIAYTFVIHDSPQQSLRLLKLLYRPINTYCIHPDYKSSPILLGIFKNIASCLANVVIPSWLESVVYNQRDTTILNAQMNCLAELLFTRIKAPERKRWKYVINLCGKELPLTSTHSIVSHLQRLNGSSSINIDKSQENLFMDRVKTKHIPLDLSIYKSTAYMALSYQFAHHLITDHTAIKIRQFFRRNCAIPEEHYYATVYMLPGTPGGHNPNLPKHPYFKITNSFWREITHFSFFRSPHNKSCHGRYVHNVCIVNSADFKEVLRFSNNGKKAFFHNKYFMEDDHTIMDCAEERLVEMNKREFAKDCGRKLAQKYIK